MTIEEAIKFAKYAQHLSQFSEVREFYRMCERSLSAQQTPDKLDTIRHKGCDMCMDKSKDWGEGGAHDFRVDGDGLYYFDSRFGWEGTKINFCPQCGRPLSEDVRVEPGKRLEENDGCGGRRRRREEETK